MKLKIIISAALLTSILPCVAQTNPLIVPAKVRLPKDSAILPSLLEALNGFLKEKEKPNSENSFVLKKNF